MTTRAASHEFEKALSTHSSDIIDCEISSSVCVQMIICFRELDFRVESGGGVLDEFLMLLRMDEE